MEDKLLQSFGEYLLTREARAIVGKVCKRFELFSVGKETISVKELELLKENVKELLYEWTRDLKKFLETGETIIQINEKSK